MLKPTRNGSAPGRASAPLRAYATRNGRPRRPSDANRNASRHLHEVDTHLAVEALIAALADMRSKRIL